MTQRCLTHYQANKGKVRILATNRKTTQICSTAIILKTFAVAQYHTQRRNYCKYTKNRHHKNSTDKSTQQWARTELFAGYIGSEGIYIDLIQDLNQNNCTGEIT